MILNDSFPTDNLALMQMRSWTVKQWHEPIPNVSWTPLNYGGKSESTPATWLYSMYLWKKVVRQSGWGMVSVKITHPSDGLTQMLWTNWVFRCTLSTHRQNLQTDPLFFSDLAHGWIMRTGYQRFSFFSSCIASTLRAFYWKCTLQSFPLPFKGPLNGFKGPLNWCGRWFVTQNYP